MRNVVLGSLLLAACAPEVAAPRWILLEGGQRVSVDSSGWARVEGARRSEDDEGMWLDFAVPPESWTATNLSGVWTAARPPDAGERKASAGKLSLAGEERRLRRHPGVTRGAHLDLLAEGEFALIGSQLFCRTSGAPGELTYSIYRERRLDVSTRRPFVGTLTGDGFSLWTGEKNLFRVEVPPRTSLRFFAAAEALGLPSQSNPRVEFVVRCDGRELLRREAPARERVDGEWLEVELPEADHGKRELVFRVEGDLALTGIFAPTLVPQDPGVPGNRPWGDPRPNLVLFVADTLRADSLAAYGGDPDRTPFLNELAAEALVFERTWSTAAWTLPAHGSMFTGLYPEQHGASEDHLALSTRLHTLAEQLQEQGYRTGAVTDSGYVSRSFGFDQGFSWFLERKQWDLGQTLEKALEFARADDGRPFFLFVQTYRTHAPYRTGSDEDQGASKDLARAAEEHSLDFGGNGEWDRAETGRRFKVLYDQGVSALDTELRPWWNELALTSTLGPGYFLFTSDHGEAFFEHEELGHGGVLWEEVLRVPLFVHGPGITPGTSSATTSLVDLSPTITGLAGVPWAALCEGRDLLADPEEAPAYSFARLAGRSMFTVVDGTRKLYGQARPRLLAKGECQGATDLVLDPHESTDMSLQADWAADLARRHAEPMSRLITSPIPAVEIELATEDRNFLNDIGYGN